MLVHVDLWTLGIRTTQITADFRPRLNREGALSSYSLTLFRNGPWDGDPGVLSTSETIQESPSPQDRQDYYRRKEVGYALQVALSLPLFFSHGKTR